MTSYNQTAVVMCDEGYRIEGDPVITCQADGTWSDNTTCRAKLAEGNILSDIIIINPFKTSYPFGGFGGFIANSSDQVQTPQDAASVQGFHCLFMTLRTILMTPNVTRILPSASYNWSIFVCLLQQTCELIQIVNFSQLMFYF